MNKREFKDKVYKELVRITQAMANPHRLEIVELLAQGEFSVEQIAGQTHLSVANASRHLQVLKAAQLVEISRHGNFIFYRLSNSQVFKVWKELRELGVERISAIDKIVREFRQSGFDFETLTIGELLTKMQIGNIILLDVRPESEFKQGHIENAVSMPIEELWQRLKELPKNTEIVAYCRGPFCVFADEAVAILRNSGYKAKRLQEGFPEWKLLNLPVEVGIN